MNKIAMKFNTFQLENICIAVLNNANNKKFVGNVKSLFDLFTPESYNNDSEKEIRVYLVKKILDLILKENISDKDSILNLIDLDGRFVNECTDLLNNLSGLTIGESEMVSLDKKISSQLRYNALDKSTNTLLDQLSAFQTENYDDLDEHIQAISNTIDVVNKQMRDAKESIEDSKKNISLSDSAFGGVLSNLIQKERNPSTKIKTGVQFLNTMLNGGWEKGQQYLTALKI